MKFDNDAYFFKHENCLDVFLIVDTVVMDSGRNAIIWANWMAQGTEHYWDVSERVRIKIKPSEYEKWKPYTPKGRYYGT